MTPSDIYFAAFCGARDALPLASKALWAAKKAALHASLGLPFEHPLRAAYTEAARKCDRDPYCRIVVKLGRAYSNVYNAEQDAARKAVAA